MCKSYAKEQRFLIRKRCLVLSGEAALSCLATIELCKLFSRENIEYHVLHHPSIIWMWRRKDDAWIIEAGNKTC